MGIKLTNLLNTNTGEFGVKFLSIEEIDEVIA